MSDRPVAADAVTPVELSIDARGLELKALAFGDAHLPPLLALHGWMDNAASFMPLAPLLKRFYVVALDLPGHGRSAFRPAGASYFHADYALDVMHAADALELDSFALMGHSMGGGVATLVAAAVPDRVEHLILIDGLGPYSNSSQDAAQQLGRAIRQSLMPASQPRRYHSFDELLDRRATASSDIAREALALIVTRNAVQQFDDEHKPFWQWCTDPRLKLASPTRLTHESVLHLLADIKAPVLNLVASTGMMTTIDAFKERREQLSNVQMLTIEGHHHFHLDGAVAQVAELVTQFVDATPAYRHTT